ncbi:MAG TPA: inorganic diphosphatase [Gammaproteobacteria bacterium]|nr:inorganic diphosphatase [Gammaproteobacteria bacterium]
MNLDRVGPGDNPPEEINVIIEIPIRGEPVKYELDKETGALFVDRYLNTSMVYPCNYGYVPRTLALDGDPVDVLIATSMPLIHGSVMRCNPIGVLQMTDEAGDDSKILAIPIFKVSRFHQNVSSPEDLQPALRDQIWHFFEHYKDLEPNKWVKVNGWGDAEAAKKEIVDSLERYKASPEKLNF